MIRHNPPGRGHAYRPSLDQRIPHIPISGENVTVRALAAPTVTELLVEVESPDGVAVVPAELVDSGPSKTTPDGHLAEAAEAGEHIGDLHPWEANLGAFTDPVRYRFSSSETSTGWYRFKPALWTPRRGDLRVQGNDDRLVSDSVEWLIDGQGARRVRFALRLVENEAVVGLGERYHDVDQRGHVVDTFVFEQYRDQDKRTYLPVPFALVTGEVGWGFWVEATRRCWFDVGVSQPDRIWIEVALGDDPELNLHFWEGTPQEVLGGFLDLTGRPGTIPDWALRPWMSSNEWNTQQRVLAEVGRSHELDIPVGVIVIEAWSDEGTMTIFRDAEYEVNADGSPHRLVDFTFPEGGAWPDPVQMVDELHELGVRVLLWQIPVITASAESPQLSADRRALVENGYAVCEEDGSPYHNRGWWFPGALLPDFTSEAATAWWMEKRRYLLEDVGIDGFKTDGGEHAWGDGLRFADGTRGDETHNRFPNLYAEAYHRLIQSTGKEGVTFSRAGFTGAGRWPAHWAGDEASTWEAFKASIRAGLTAGVSGVFVWSWDLAGFSGEIPDADLYLRSAAMACFSPLMQYHSEHNGHRTPLRDRTPWNIADRNEAPYVLDVYRSFAKLRDRLVPYLSTELRAGIEDARPLMRPMSFDWPHDREVWRYPLQYMLGRDMLVAPVTEPGITKWSVYLPGEDWVDAWTGEVIGPGDVIVDAPIERIPVFLRHENTEDLMTLFQR